MVSSWPATGTRNLGAFVDNVCPKSGPVKKWDGAARTSKSWDGLRKDPELWLRNGNCHVYLHAKGQSKRGPSFKLPFKELIAKKCYPLIERFLIAEGPAPRTPRQLEKWASDPKRIVELYIPPPPNADKEQAYVYHVATRNFFAWIFRRSMVGEHLGKALVGLLCSMHEFRMDVRDNVDDMMDYMDEEGYLDLVNQPDHALAMLTLSETFQLEDLYKRAFAHCVGMNDLLHVSPEYQTLSAATKRMIRQAKIDLDNRLDTATDMLDDFLDEELSESHLGLPTSTRAHLERFRSFLLSYYTTRFGYYPPRGFDPNVCKTMRDEFEALYKLLVDEEFSVYGHPPALATGGICTLQTVQAFDAKHGYESLTHPLPLLPQYNPKISQRRMPWRRGVEKLRPDQKLLAHTSLIKASNWREKAFHNDLVRAYRVFEEDSVMPVSKADRQEKVSLVDGRKVRWILVYATYQVLRSITDVPPQVFDSEEAPYHLAVSMRNLPPWDTQINIEKLLRRQTDLAVPPRSPSICWVDSAGWSDGSGKIEIKPDIDYLSLKQQPPSPNRRTSTRGSIRGSVRGSTRGSTEVPRSSSGLPLRSGSVSHALGRNSTIRRSIRIFKPVGTPILAPAPSPREALSLSKPVHREIVIQGYGNGLSYVSSTSPVPRAQAERPTVRHNSTVSTSGSSTNASLLGSVASGSTIESILITPTSATMPAEAYTLPPNARPHSQKRNVVSMILHSRSNSSTGGYSTTRPSSSILRPSSSAIPSSRGSNWHSTGWNATFGLNYSDVYKDLVEEQRQSFFGADAPMSPKQKATQPRLAADDDWATMQAFMHGMDSDADEPVQKRSAWEQYADLGGLTEMR